MHNKKTLDEWLSWQEQLMEETIVLGLDRVQLVYQRLFPDGVPFFAITVGGIGNSPKPLIFTVINKAIIRQKPAPNAKSHVWASTTGKFLHDMATIPKVIPSAPRIILNAAAT